MTNGTKALMLSIGLAAVMMLVQVVGNLSDNAILVGMLTGINYLLWLERLDRLSARKERNDQ